MMEAHGWRSDLFIVEKTTLNIAVIYFGRRPSYSCGQQISELTDKRTFTSGTHSWATLNVTVLSDRSGVVTFRKGVMITFKFEILCHIYWRKRVLNKESIPCTQNYYSKPYEKKIRMWGCWWITTNMQGAHSFKISLPSNSFVKKFW